VVPERGLDQAGDGLLKGVVQEGAIVGLGRDLLPLGREGDLGVVGEAQAGCVGRDVLRGEQVDRWGAWCCPRAGPSTGCGGRSVDGSMALAEAVRLRKPSLHSQAAVGCLCWTAVGCLCTSFGRV
jgi:hypothetical protein